MKANGATGAKTNTLSPATPATPATNPVDALLELLEHCDDEKARQLALRLDEGERADPRLAVPLAKLHRRLGDRLAARMLLEARLDEAPSDHEALRACAWIDLADGDPVAALDRCEKVLAARPKDFGALKIKATALAGLGAPLKAAGILRRLHRRKPRSADILMRLARARRDLGHLPAADGHFAQVLAIDARRKPAWKARIEIAVERGDLDGAVLICDEALGAIRGDAELLRKRAALLKRSGRIAEAATTLSDLLKLAPEDRAARHALAELELAAGHVDKAVAGFRSLVAERPEEKQALLGLVQALERRGDDDEALALLEARMFEDDAGGAIAEMPGIALAYCAVAARMGRSDRVEEVLQIVSAGVDRFDVDTLVSLANVARKVEHQAVMATAIDRLAQAEPLSMPAALVLLQTAFGVGRHELARGVASKIDSRIVEEDRLRFEYVRAGLLDGPVAAIGPLRAATGPRRSLDHARMLAEALLEAGFSPLAFRYLRAGRRRWPDSLVIGRLYIRACLLTGREDGALAAVDTMERQDGVSLPLLRYNVLLEAGRQYEAAELAQHIVGEGGLRPQPMQMIRMMVALGRVEEAEAHVPALLAGGGSAARSETHFRTTQVGQMINELKIQSHFEAGGDSDFERDPDHFFHPAKRIVEEWMAEEPPRPAPPDAPPVIPARILQYWDRPSAPSEVALLMASWERAEGFDYERFDKARAKSFLREEFGEQYLRAFRAANNVAEQCDFLRLCLLYRMGGIYADADDRLTGDAASLIRCPAELLLFVEPMGAIANNVMCAAPEHPVIGNALEKAMASILARENDSTWAKTGPGLITRVVARHILDARDKGEPVQLCLQSRSVLRRNVHPHVKLSYKSGAAYWNATRATVPAALRGALEKFAAS